MLEFLQTNWFWLLLGAGVIWFLFRQGGCGMGSHGSHGSESSRSTTPNSDHEHAGPSEARPTRSGARRGRHGCC